jgi:hypothetical protein
VRNPILTYGDLAMLALGGAVGFGVATLADRFACTYNKEVNPGYQGKDSRLQSAAADATVAEKLALISTNQGIVVKQQDQKAGWRRILATTGVTALGVGVAVLAGKHPKLRYAAAGVAAGAGIKLLGQVLGGYVLPMLLPAKLSNKPVIGQLFANEYQAKYTAMLKTTPPGQLSGSAPSALGVGGYGPVARVAVGCSCGAPLDGPHFAGCPKAQVQARAASAPPSKVTSLDDFIAGRVG